MNYQRDTILKDLRENVLALYIKDNTGKEHELRCTLMSDRLPASYLTEKNEEIKFHEENPNMIATWNILKNMWITLDISDIKYVQILDAYQY